jgi:hypothetical protein
MALNAINAFNSDTRSIYMKNLAGYALVLASDNQNFVILLNLRHG